MRRLRVALLSYRSKPHSGGQGVYVRHLARELVALGHEVTVFSGPPYPQLTPGVRLEKVSSLDLYREPDPFRVPRPREFRDAIDAFEFANMCTAGFPEPLTFSLRVARLLRARAGEFDVVHDNQGLGYGMLDVARRLPLVTTIHHPITRDRAADLEAATGLRRLTLRRWYGFLRMQARVARAQRHVLTVSRSSAGDIVTDFRVRPGAVHVVPLGVETDVFHPGAAAARVPGRIVAMASADTPLKGVDTFLHALARARTGRDVEAILVMRPTPGGLTERLVARLGLGDVVRFVDGLDQSEVARLLASAQIACVPSRYEGFSLPTLEAMSCGTALAVTAGGAIPEVVGEPGRCAEVVAPGDDAALGGALAALLDDPARCERLGAAGRARAVERFSWPAVARTTTEVYEAAIRDRPGPGGAEEASAAGLVARPYEPEGDAA